MATGTIGQMRAEIFPGEEIEMELDVEFETSRSKAKVFLVQNWETFVLALDDTTANKALVTNLEQILAADFKTVRPCRCDIMFVPREKLGGRKLVERIIKKGIKPSNFHGGGPLWTSW